MVYRHKLYLFLNCFLSIFFIYSLSIFSQFNCLAAAVTVVAPKPVSNWFLKGNSVCCQLSHWHLIRLAVKCQTHALTLTADRRTYTRMQNLAHTHIQTCILRKRQKNRTNWLLSVNSLLKPNLDLKIFDKKFCKKNLKNKFEKQNFF